MKNPSNQPIRLQDIQGKIRDYIPWAPAILVTQLLSSILADAEIVKNNRILRLIFDKGLSLPALSLLAYVAMKDMRDTTDQWYQEELKKYVGMPRHREPDNALKVILIGGQEQSFTNLDKLAEFLSMQGMTVASNRAARSFDAARRAVILGWTDSYALRMGEFLATRSLEQCMLDIFPSDKSKNNGYLRSLSGSVNACLNRDGTPNPGAESFINFVRNEIPAMANMRDVLDAIIQKRNEFAHRCESLDQESILDFSSFELARACLKFRR